MKKEVCGDCGSEDPVDDAYTISTRHCCTYSKGVEPREIIYGLSCYPWSQIGPDTDTNKDIKLCKKCMIKHLNIAVRRLENENKSKDENNS